MKKHELQYSIARANAICDEITDQLAEIRRSAKPGAMNTEETRRLETKRHAFAALAEEYELQLGFHAYD